LKKENIEYLKKLTEDAENPMELLLLTLSLIDEMEHDLSEFELIGISRLKEFILVIKKQNPKKFINIQFCDSEVYE